MQQDKVEHQIVLWFKQLDNTIDEIEIPLVHNYTIEEINEQLFVDGAVLEQMRIYIGQHMQALKDKKTKDSNHLLAQSNINLFLEYLSDQKQTSQVKTIQFINRDTQFNATDQVLTWMQKQEFTTAKQLQFECLHISDEQLTKLADIISENMKSMESLKVDFIYRGKGLKQKSLGEKHQLKNLYVNRICSHELLELLRYFPSLKHLFISFSYNQEIKIDQAIKQINLISPWIQSLSLQFCSVSPFKPDCIKEVERLNNLTSLTIEMPRVLSQKDLDLICLKSLESLCLKSYDPNEYLSGINKDHSIKYLDIENTNPRSSKECKNLNMTNLNHLQKLSWVFSCNQKSGLEQLQNDLKEIARIAHQLVELTLDFSKCDYFSKRAMDGITIEALGNIFEKCNKETQISLIIDGCLLTKKEKLDLALQLQKITNIDEFKLNDDNLVERLNRSYNEHDNIIYANYGTYEYMPYFYGIISLLPQYYQTIIPICIEKSLPPNLSIDNNYRYFFTKFSKFKVTDFADGGDLSFSEYLKKILPEDVKYIEIQNIISLDELVQIKDNYDNLQKLSCMIQNRDKLCTTKLEKMKRKGIEIEITIYSGPLNYNDFFNIFLFEQDIITLILEVTQVEDYSSLMKLFEKINKDKQILSVQIREEEKGEYAKSVKLVNEFCEMLPAEKLKILCFEKMIKSFLPINPNLIYTDLQIE